MSKYIRITSSNEATSDVSNYFSAGIELNPNSSVALESLSLIVDTSKIIVTSIANALVVRNYDEQLPQNTAIEDNVYTAGTFIDELSDVLNRTTDLLEPNGIRTEWKPNFSSNKLNIQYLTCTDMRGADVEFVRSNTMIEEDAGNRTFYTGNTPTGGGWVYSGLPFINGAGLAVFPVVTASGAAPNNFCVGLLKHLPLSADTLDFNNFLIGLAAVPGENFLKVYFNGQLYATTDCLRTSLDKDPNFLVLKVENGELSFQIYNQDTALYTTIFTFGTEEEPAEWELGQVLHVAFLQKAMVNPSKIIWIDSGNAANSFVFTPSPYVNAVSGNIQLIQDNSEKVQDGTYLQISNNLSVLVPTYHSLQFSDGTKLFLGYTNNFYESTAIGDSFLAEASMDLFIEQKDLVIESPSFMLDSYDGAQSRRRSILRVVPAEQFTQATYIRRYTTAYPIYINLKNKDKVLLNSIQVRVCSDIDNKPIPIFPINGMSANLIIKDKEE